MHRLRGTYQLESLGGLYRAYPALAVLFLIPALSLAGIPPLSGFWAKLSLIQAALNAQEYVIAGTALAVGVLTLFSMTKIWAEAFWKESAEAEDSEQAGRAGGRGSWAVMLLPIALLAALTVTIGLAAEPILVLSARAAEELLNPANYVHIVLEGLP